MRFGKNFMEIKFELVSLNPGGPTSTVKANRHLAMSLLNSMRKKCPKLVRPELKVKLEGFDSSEQFVCEYDEINLTILGGRLPQIRSVKLKMTEAKDKPKF